MNFCKKLLVFCFIMIEYPTNAEIADTDRPSRNMIFKSVQNNGVKSTMPAMLDSNVAKAPSEISIPTFTPDKIIPAVNPFIAKMNSNYAQQSVLPSIKIADDEPLKEELLAPKNINTFMPTFPVQD